MQQQSDQILHVCLDLKLMAVSTRKSNQQFSSQMPLFLLQCQLKHKIHQYRYQQPRLQQYKDNFVINCIQQSRATIRRLRKEQNIQIENEQQQLNNEAFEGRMDAQKFRNYLKNNEFYQDLYLEGNNQIDFQNCNTFKIKPLQMYQMVEAMQKLNLKTTDIIEEHMMLSERQQEFSLSLQEYHLSIQESKQEYIMGYKDILAMKINEFYADQSIENKLMEWLKSQFLTPLNYLEFSIHLRTSKDSLLLKKALQNLDQQVPQHWRKLYIFYRSGQKDIALKLIDFLTQERIIKQDYYQCLRYIYQQQALTRINSKKVLRTLDLPEHKWLVGKLMHIDLPKNIEQLQMGKPDGLSFLITAWDVVSHSIFEEVPLHQSPYYKKLVQMLVCQIEKTLNLDISIELLCNLGAHRELIKGIKQGIYRQYSLTGTTSKLNKISESQSIGPTTCLLALTVILQKSQNIDYYYLQKLRDELCEIEGHIKEPTSENIYYNAYFADILLSHLPYYYLRSKDFQEVKHIMAYNQYLVQYILVQSPHSMGLFENPQEIILHVASIYDNHLALAQHLLIPYIDINFLGKTVGRASMTSKKTFRTMMRSQRLMNTQGKEPRSSKKLNNSQINRSKYLDGEKYAYAVFKQMLVKILMGHHNCPEEVHALYQIVTLLKNTTKRCLDQYNETELLYSAILLEIDVDHKRNKQIIDKLNNLLIESKQERKDLIVRKLHERIDAIPYASYMNKVISAIQYVYTIGQQRRHNQNYLSCLCDSLYEVLAKAKLFYGYEKHLSLIEDRMHKIMHKIR